MSSAKITYSIKGGPRKSKPWFDKDCYDMKKLAKESLKKYRKTNRLEDRECYASSRKKYLALLDLKRKGFDNEKQEILRNAKDSKTFWKTIALYKSTSNPRRISIQDWLNFYRELMTTEKNLRICNLHNVISQNDPLLDSEITNADIYKEIAGLRSNKACGPDGIPNEVLKTLPDSYILLLKQLYNSVMTTGKYPAIWTNSTIHPIFKNGYKNSPSNYRDLPSVNLPEFGDIHLLLYADDIAIIADTHLGASTVHRLWRRWLEQGNVAIYRNVGATRVTSARVDRRILRQAVAAPQATCTAILQHVQDTLDHSISTRTISRRLVANGLHSCRPLRRLPLTPPNRRQRLEWCRARSTWMTEWHRVVFSDESRFCLSSDSRRVRVWRRRGERSNPAAIVERPTVRQRGIMVWGAIAYDSRSPLLRIQGTMTAQRYVDDVLRPVTLSYLQGVPNALYQQDNARPHTARISQQALQDLQMLPWPPYSPDLSPIEHVWDIIGRSLHALPQPRSEDELWQMVEREWRAIPQDAIRTLIDSLPRRVAACIAVRGGPTCY
ncbi:Transposase [Cordylochernes scorpioides]|uniref:Transposase n=1 Tax=Cordylochernes scorpioides TaxID=51811 RepID=A0ABY6LW02_9ARAC|nr:Transposase [Cordylochernes scorpioides]